jgi:hypothetical protein
LSVRVRKPAKLNKPRLIGMKVQSKASEPRLEISKELLCFVPMLKADDGIVRVAHDDHVAFGAALPPLVGPLIIDVMEVDVRQEWADGSSNAKDNLRFPAARCLCHRQGDHCLIGWAKGCSAG